MKCPKCGYTSFPYMGSCGKCGRPQLADTRALYGVYALPPNPPDLMLINEPTQADSPAMMPKETIASPAIDLSQLGEIGLELASPDDTVVNAVEGEIHLEVVEENMAGLDLELLLGGNTSPLPLSPEPDLGNRQDAPPQTTLDLSALTELTLELEDISTTASPPIDLDKLPTMTDVKQIFELDLEDENVSLTITPVAEDPPAHHDDEEVETEYILEIEDEFELTVEKLDLEDDPDETTTDVEDDDDVR
jgi:hypothetical protein